MTSGIRIGKFHFQKKANARACIRRILHSAAPGKPLEGDDGELIRALFALHPSAAILKQRLGLVLSITAQEHQYGGVTMRGFYAHLMRERVAFSYLTCLNPKRSVPDPLAVMRRAIMPGQHHFKLAFFDFRHDITRRGACGHPMSFNDADVHHRTPEFRHIAAAYMAKYGAPRCESAILGDDFVDPAERTRWLAFHDARAQLEVICRSCHRRLPR